MFCSKCGNVVPANAAFCGNCGAATNQAGAAKAAPSAAGTDYSQAYAYPAQQPVYVTPAPPQRDFVSTWLLSWFLGSLGVDRFYLGYVGLGIAKLCVTLFTFGFGGFVWHWIDLILVLSGRMTDFQGRPLLDYENKKRMAIWVTVGVSAVSLLIAVIIISVFVIAAVSAWQAGQNDYGYDY